MRSLLSYHMYTVVMATPLTRCVSYTGMPKEINKAKIACLDFSLQKAKMHLGVSVVVDDPEKLEAIRKRYVECVNRGLNKQL